MSERRLAAIMFTDITGYTALMGKDEDRAVEMLQINREIHTRMLEKHHGTLIKEMGDGILTSFNSSFDAVKCALEIQSESKKKEIPLKIGIHEGDMIFEGDDVLGDGVNIASRLQDITETGGISISESIYKNVKNKPGIYAAFLEEKLLKNVDEPVKVYRVSDVEILEKKKPAEKIKRPVYRRSTPYLILGGIFIFIVAAVMIWKNLPDKEPEIATVDQSIIPDKSIAVLPFKNNSPDPDNEYFCNAMLDEILNQLALIADMKVKSRTSVEQYRNPTQDARIIGAALEVAFILEGSVQKMGENIRIITQLIDVKTGDHLWSEKFDGKYSNELFDFQSEVSKKIASSLNSLITPEEERRLTYTPPTNMEAYDFFIRGRQEMRRAYGDWGNADNENAGTAMWLYNESLKLDPDYPDVFAAKGEVFNFYGDFDSALYYCNKALEIEPELILGNWIKGETYWFMKEYDLALEYLIKTVNMEPNGQRNLYSRIVKIYFEQKKDYVQALKYLKKFIEEEPWEGNHDAGGIFFQIGDYERAEKHYLWMVQSEHPYFGIHYYLLTLETQGKFREALRFLDSIDSICSINETYSKLCIRGKWLHYVNLKEFEKAERYYDQLIDSGGHINQFDSSTLAYMYRGLGQNEKAMNILNKVCNSFENILKSYSGDMRMYAIYNLPHIYACMDEKEKTLNALRERREKAGFIEVTENNPLFENLWDNPEFKEIIKTVKEEKAEIRAQIKELEERGEINL